ncbi:TetR/AcrR family transcriptional regulator [Cryobacterium sp. Y50]|uniref:TetR/AcrR family transcriptional regulator n=1 Tax=Cryobacterium sp. Y50 TaxID=2048286 RepID=UPI000CE40ABF|nr:TetR/AcrR family transcriptional regulator [Cryobacterium sp. Y50]
MVETGRSRAPRRDQQRNREALIAAGFEVFAESGINAPLNAIAKRAGVSGATLYRHFSDRHKLIEAVLLVNLIQHEEVISNAMAADTGWDGLMAYVSWLWEEQLKNVGYLSALREIAAGQSPEVDRLRDFITEGFTSLVRRAKSEGRIRADRWAEDLLLLIYLNEQLVILPEEEARAASRRLLELAVASITAEPQMRTDTEPSDVQILRKHLLHRLAGHSQ